MKSITAKRRTVFTIDDANQMLPLVRAIVADIVGLWSDLIERRERLSFVLCDRDIEQNDDVYSQELAQIDRGLQRDTRRLESLLKELKDLGVVPGGPTGNVGFPAVVDGRKVQLSWKLGEEEVAYWHEFDQDFDERVSLTAETLSHDANQNGIYLDVN